MADTKETKADREILGALLLPMAGKGGKGPKPEDEGATPEDDAAEDMDAEEQLSAVADELFDAVKADDREGFREGLRSYVSMCRMLDEG